MPYFSDDGDFLPLANLAPIQTSLPIISQSHIFYLRIQRPSLQAIDVLGPYASTVGTVAGITLYMQEHYGPGMPQLNAQISTQAGEDIFFHIGMAITGDHHHVMDIEVLKEVNEDVKSVIKMQPVWTVLCTEMQHNDPRPATIKSRDVRCTFPPTKNGEEQAKQLARAIAEEKIAGFDPPDAEIVSRYSGVKGVNVIYNVVGTGKGWSIEANFHLDPTIIFEGASDENGQPLDGVVLNPVLLAQQHMHQQW